MDIGQLRVFAHSFAVNSRGDIILLYDDRITVIYSTGEKKDVMLRNTTEKWYETSVAVDSDDNVYAIRWRRVSDENGDYKYDFVLYAFDDNYNIKNVSVLDFLHADRWSYVIIAVDKNQNLIMLNNRNNQVYVCDNTGKLKFQFQRHGERLRSLSTSNNNDIMIVSDDRCTIHTYSPDGDLKSIIEVQDGHRARMVAFHYGTGKIVVLTYNEKDQSYFLFSYSEACELVNSVLFCKKDPEASRSYREMKSHPSGLLAVWYNNSITFL